MESYRLEIYSYEDIDLIEDIEEREEAQEAYEDEIEAVYQQLKFDKIEFDQITDNIFSITLDTYKDRFNDEILEKIQSNLKIILEQKDITNYTIENYQEA